MPTRTSTSSATSAGTTSEQAAAAAREATRAVEIVGIGKSFADVHALREVSLLLDQGEFLAVLGPSGCGKTTLLRCMAGFERIDHGRIALGGRAVALPGIHLPPHRRQVAVVPQEGALFPHLSVAENVGFGLGRQSLRGARGTSRAHRIDECLELVGLAGLGRRMPHELSGGQQQRVALARALAPRPPLVLLDEPFSALDATLRVDLRRDVRAALRETDTTAILVTHDQGEALSMADRVAVMRDGELRQVGTPEEVYLSPADAWVASFVGEADLVPLPATGPGPDRRIQTPLGPVTVGEAAFLGADHVVIRPEQVVLGHPEGVPAVVRSVDFHGHDALIALELSDGSTAHARTFTTRPPVVGDRVKVGVAGQCRVVPSGGVGPEPGHTA
ncbi:ABC transporter ATP-binding protein [Ornithinimicrobium sp. Y1694]|uniref:ABC transporter ATP-binding protein n=1 Tax=Ornithinimicrobium sp. Y1694 TaxID=3418590 RepID=UPI003CEC03E6